MNRILKVVLLMVAMACAAPAASLAASSPTVITGAASSVADTSVVLHARINPNGVQTGYVFNYGPTTAFGAVSVSHSTGHGTKGVDVTTAIAGLTPGTVYYYEVSATSTAGTTVGAIRHFTTTGHLPPAVVTGNAVDVFKTRATPTGLINANGAATTWQVQYGLTAAYGLSTAVTLLDARHGHRPAGLRRDPRAGPGDAVPLPDRRHPRRHSLRTAPTRRSSPSPTIRRHRASRPTPRPAATPSRRTRSPPPARWVARASFRPPIAAPATSASGSTTARSSSRWSSRPSAATASSPRRRRSSTPAVRARSPLRVTVELPRKRLHRAGEPHQPRHRRLAPPAVSRVSPAGALGSRRWGTAGRGYRASSCCCWRRLPRGGCFRSSCCSSTPVRPTRASPAPTA